MHEQLSGSIIILYSYCYNYLQIITLYNCSTACWAARHGAQPIYSWTCGAAWHSFPCFMLALATLLLIAASPTIEDLAAQIEALTQEVRKLKSAAARDAINYATKHRELDIEVDSLKQLLEGSTEPAPVAPSAALPPPRRRLQGTTTSTTCTASPTNSPASLTLRPPGQLGEVLHGATLTSQATGELTINSTGSIALNSPAELVLNGTGITAHGIVAAPGVQATGTVSAAAISTSGSVTTDSLHVAGTVTMGASSASTSYKLTLTSDTGSHLRLDNGGEAAFIRLLTDGSLDLWSHGSATNNMISFRQGSGSGEQVMRLDTSGNLWILGGLTLGQPTQGQTTFGVVQYFTGDSSTTEYFHLRMPTPFNVDAATSDMYHIHVTGYCFSSRIILDLTYAGYRTPPSNGGPHSYFTNVDPLGTTSERLAYHGSDGRLYLRFKVGQVYYCTFRGDSMFVGNGYALTQGDITVVKSTTAQL